MELKWQLIISIGVPIATSVLTYLAAIAKTKVDIKAIEIGAETEIIKIKEESNKEIKNIEIKYQKQIEKMKIETEEQIKLKVDELELATKGDEDKMKNQMVMKFLEEFMINPQKGKMTLEELMNFSNQFGFNETNNK